MLAKRMGSRIYKGKPCLGITEADAMERIETEIYVIGFARNRHVADEASGTLEYAPKCKGSATAQLWMYDVCRNTAEGVKKPKTSPLKALIRVFAEIGRAAGVSELYLDVENKEPEKSVLPTQYRKYGFTIAKACEQSDGDYIVMRKQLGLHGRHGRHHGRTRRHIPQNPRSVTRKVSRLPSLYHLD